LISLFAFNSVISAFNFSNSFYVFSNSANVSFCFFVIISNLSLIGATYYSTSYNFSVDKTHLNNAQHDSEEA